MTNGFFPALLAFIKVLPFLPKRWVLNVIAIQEKKVYNFYVVIIFSAFVGIMRYTLELLLAHKSFLSLNAALVQHLVFYLHCIFIYTFILKLFIPKVSWKQLVPLVLIGVFLGIFPPLLDVLIYGAGEFKYNYVVKIAEDWNWWIYNKGAQVPLGEAGILFATMFFVAVVVRVKTQSWLFTLLSAFLAYLAVFFYGGIFPLFAEHAFVAMQASAQIAERFVLNENAPAGFSLPVQIAFFQLFLCVLIYFILNPQLLLGLIKRLNHAVPVVLTCLLGYSLYKPLDGFAFFISIVFFLLSLMVIVQNDFFDSEDDKTQKRLNYVNKDDVAFFNIVSGILCLLFIFSANFAGYMMLLFFLVAILYNYDFYRGKQYFPTNYKIEGIAGLSAFLGGIAMMISVHYGLAGDALNVDNFNRIKEVGYILPELYKEVFYARYLWIIFFVFGGWSILSVIKDYKDIDSDQLARHQTIYTILSRRGVSISKFHRLYTLVLSLCMFVPLYWLYLIQAHWFFYTVLLLLALGFFIVINQAANKRTVAFSLSLMNVYLLSLVIAFHLSHA